MSADLRLTAQELEIMKVVWDAGQATVREVYEVLRQRRQLAYTTVSTMMGILESKGHLRKERQGRAFLYSPTRPRREVVAGMVSDFVERVFNGSARPLVLHLLEERRLSEDDIEELARLINEKDSAGDV